MSFTNSESVKTITPEWDSFKGNMRIKIPSKRDTVLHKHTFFEITYVKSGHIMHSINDEPKVPMYPGDYIFVDIGSCHQIDICDGEIINLGFSSTSVTKHLPVCTSLLQLLLYPAFAIIGMAANPFPVDQILHDDGYVLSVLDLINDNYTNYSESNSLPMYVIKYQLISLILYIAHKHCLFDTEPSINHIVQKMLEIISHHYNESNTLEIAARELSYTPSYLSQEFKKALGINYKEYLQQFRLDKAMYMLKTSDMKIIDISATVGYADHKFFAKIFKKHTGMTPSEYRASIFIDTPIHTL